MKSTSGETYRFGGEFSGSQHGQQTTLTSFHTTLLHLGLAIVACRTAYGAPDENSEVNRITGFYSAEALALFGPPPLYTQAPLEQTELPWYQIFETERPPQLALSRSGPNSHQNR